MKFNGLYAVLVVGGFAWMTNAAAHDLWVHVAHAEAGKTLHVEMGYGHDFPKVESIPAERVSLFEPMRLFSGNGHGEALKVGLAAHQYSSTQPLKAQTYTVTATYKPTFWSQNADGWKPVNRNTMKDAQHCGEYSMFAKSFAQAGADKQSIVKKAVGQKLEIVPTIALNQIKVDQPLPLQVLYDGRPLKGATVQGTFEGFPKDQKAFSGKTGLKGEIALMPLRRGVWLITVEHTVPYPDKTVCDERTLLSTLVLNVQ